MKKNSLGFFLFILFYYQNNAVGMKYFYQLVILLSMLTFYSCQIEDDYIKQNINYSLTKNSPLTSLMTRVVQNPTFDDNIIDDSGCFSLELPVIVYVNDYQFRIESEADYDAVEEAMKESDLDDDIVHLQFPVTIIYYDFHQIVINSQEEWDEVINECDEDYHEIKCVDFNYPFEVCIYDVQNQQYDKTTISNDQDLSQYLKNLLQNDVYGIVYPISLTNSNYQNIVINNNSDLEEAIELAINLCEDEGSNPNELIEILTSGSWYISYCFLGTDKTSDYDGYDFEFSSNGTIKAIKDTVIFGEWDLKEEYGYMRLDLRFDGSVLDLLDDNWMVVENSENTIRLKLKEEEYAESAYITFKKNQ